jgi:glycopeptide antibiotics resistance protein
MTDTRGKATKLTTRVVYALYFIVLLAVVTCKVQSIVYSVPDGGYIHETRETILQNREIGYWNYNFEPLKAYRGWYNIGLYGVILHNLLGNIVAFVPMGYFEMALSRDRKLWKVILKCFVVVTLLEVLQFVTCLGYLDIDDITMNTFGCLLGCLGFYLLASIRRKAEKTFLLKKKKINF